MKTDSVHLYCSAWVAATLAAIVVGMPSSAVAQKTQSRVTPLIVHPSAEPIGASLLLSHERLDLSTITREDRTLRVGRELAQGESVTRLRMQKDRISPDTERERRQAVIREQDNLRHKRISVIYDD